MPDYDNGKIYKIVCNKTNKIYIGSTCQSTLAKRLTKHKLSFKSWKNNKYGYMSSYEILENGDFDIVLIESYPCKNRDELTSRERFYIDSLECVNMQRSICTEKERNERYKIYYAENKQKVQDKHKQYYIDNKDKIDEKNKEYSLKNIEKNKERLKKYYIANREKILEKERQRYIENKNKIFITQKQEDL